MFKIGNGNDVLGFRDDANGVEEREAVCKALEETGNQKLVNLADVIRQDGKSTPQCRIYCFKYPNGTGYQTFLEGLKTCKNKRLGNLAKGRRCWGVESIRYLDA